MSLQRFHEYRTNLREIRWTHLRYQQKADYHHQTALIVGWENYAARKSSEWGINYTDLT